MCNNRCRFCAQGDKRLTVADKSTSQIKAILKKCMSQGISGVVFTGGEPTLRQDILELAGYARSCGYQSIQIQTNGRMFAYADFCKKLIHAGVNEFAPSVHGHNAELHDYLTTAKGSFYETVKGLKNLKDLGANVFTNTVITKLNFRHLPEIASLLVKMGVEQFQFAFIHPVHRAAENFDSLVPRITLVEPYLKKALKIGLEAGKKAFSEAVPFCFMRGFEGCVAESIIPDTTIFDADLVVENYNSRRRDEGKKKGPACKKCSYYRICEGPWREYPEKFGWEEFIPVKKG